MPDDIAVPLTQDEASVLMIAAQGQSLIAIGRWEKPIDSLVKRGLLHANDKFNNVITSKGRQAHHAHEEKIELGLANAVARVNGVKPPILEQMRSPAEIGTQIAAIADMVENGAPFDRAIFVEMLRQWAQALQQ